MKKYFIAMFLMFVSVVSMAETSQGESIASTANDNNIARAEAGSNIVASAPAGGDIVAYGLADVYRWTLDANGNFVISGEEGQYAVLSSEPWKNYRNEIKTIKFKGRFAFHGSCYRKFADLPNVVSIDMGSYINNTMVTNMSYMYADCPKLVTLDLSGFWDTSFVQDMSYMFYNCNRLLTVNLSSFDTSSVVDMSHMFEYCYNLVFVDITNFNIPKCQSLVQMFSNCRSLTEIDLSGMHCSDYINASYMFEFCEKLKRVDVTDFFTKNGKFNDMFGYYSPDMIICDNEWPASISMDTRENLRRSKVYVPQGMESRYWNSGWGYDNIYENTIVARYGNDDRRATLDITGRLLIRGDIDFSYYSIKMLFPDHLSEIKTVKFKRYNEYTTVYVNDFSFVFRDLNNLETVYFGDLVILDNQSFSLRGMFLNCSSLVCMNIPRFDTSLSIGNISNLSLERMFEGCSNLIAVNMSNFNSNVNSMASMFSGCKSIVSLNISNINTSKVLTMNSMFADCSTSGYRGYAGEYYNPIPTFDLSNFDTSYVESMSGMFYGCTGLTSLDLSNLNTRYVRNMNRIFCGCAGLTSLDLSNIDTSSVTEMSEMFYGCTGLTSLDLSNLNTSRVTDMSRMFSDCSGLTSLDLSNFDTSSVTDMSYMFSRCSGLTSLDLSNLNTRFVRNMNGMFSGCSSLEKLDLTQFCNTGLTSASTWNGFYGCSQLNAIISRSSLPSTLLEKTFEGALPTIGKCKLYVPKGALANYQNAMGWKELVGGIIEIGGSIILDDTKPYNILSDSYEEVSYVRNFKNTNWQALYIPFSMSYDDWKDDFEVARINTFFYKDGDVNDQYLNVIKVTSGSIEPNTPYLIKALEAGEKTITFQNITLYPADENYIDCASVDYRYIFTGTYDDISGEEMFNNQYFAMSGGKLMRPKSSSATLGPYRWYVEEISRHDSGSSPSKAPVIDVVVEGEEETTGILDTCGLKSETRTPDAIYNLQGQIVNEHSLAPGIYIKNGKKLFVK